MGTKRLQEKPLHAFMRHQSKINALLTRLQDHCDNHFDCTPEEINWANVGDLAHYSELLQQLSDSVFQEGEHS